ncbi:MAG: cation diffusion facilitator family transporter [Acidimicrobiales bacterium]
MTIRARRASRGSRPGQTGGRERLPMQLGHGHEGSVTTRARRVGAALAVNLVIATGEVVGGIVAHSSALFADAGHDVADVGGLALSLAAVRLARRSPTDLRSYGYHRATIVSALANVALVLVVAVLVVADAAGRIGHPGHIDGGLVAAVAGAAAVANGACALLLADGSHDLNLRAGAVHLASDALTSVGVVVVGVVVFVTGRFAVLDPALSLAIALLVALRGWTVGREGLDILLEASPGDVDIDELRTAMSSVPGVTEVHDLHCWSLSSEVRALSAHVVLEGHPSLEQANAVGDDVKACIGEPFGIVHTTLELECERCAEPDEVTCAIDDRSPIRSPARLATAQILSSERARTGGTAPTR